MKKLLLIICLAYSASQLYAQKLNLPKNKAFEITRIEKDKGTYGSNTEYAYAFKSLGKNAEGNILLEGKLVRAVIGYDRLGGEVLNTDSLRKTNFNSSAVLSPLALLHKPFKVTLTPEGKVLEVTGMDEALRSTMNSWSIDPEVSRNILETSNENFKTAMQGLFFTAAPVKIDGQDGKSTKIDGMGSLKLISKNAISSTYQSSNVNEDVKYDQKVILDAQTGLVQNQLEKSFTQFKKSPQSGISPKAKIDLTRMQKLSAVKPYKTPDTGWVNMASKLSYWSKSIKPNTNYDSVKVMQMVNSPDARFMNDIYYRQKLLNAVQGLKGDEADRLYDKMLNETPNKYLAGSSSSHHVQNKLGGALDVFDIASVYDLSKIAAQTTGLEDWMQHSFYQYILYGNYDDEAKRRKAKAYEFLAMARTDKDPKYIERINPLYYWATAFKDLDEAALVKAGNQFIAMGDREMKVGNGGRYALLTYKLLLDKGKRAEAEKLLVSTIGKLDRYAADTLDKDRFQHKNLLAGAYYLRYLDEVKQENTNALKSLSMAAQLSPKGPKEKNYTSNYDQAALKTKESYRDVFIEKLLGNGEEDMALKIFAEHVTAMPDNIAEMKQLYEKKFPNKDFKAFFADQIVGTWPVAPVFSVKGIDGKAYQLADFKNQWTVIDFWGTWCGPCREEMPVVNKFSTQVADGKFKNVRFLSIACSDTDEKVKQYINENKFTMPVAMSDGDVERNYKVRGYPSKIIISPTGKMIQVDFGKDWQAVIKNFSEI
ncbi:MAG: DUF6263 family protein [Bacteroidota bacterium]